MQSVSSTTTGAVTAATGTRSGTARNQLSADMDNFLKLLTVQLQNQDPLEPMDTNQFTQQLIQYANVEQQIASNQNLEKLTKLTSGNQATSALQYLGKTVELEGDSVTLKDSKATIRFNGQKAAAVTNVEILNSKNEVIRTLPAPTDSGSQTVAWDGKDASGVRLADGSYNVRIKATDNAGGVVERSTITTGLVEAVSTSDSGIELTVAGKPIAADKILRVR